MKKKYISIFSLMFTLLSGVSHAALTEGVEFPETLKVQNKPLLLNGTGVRTKKILLLKIKVYAAALYLESKTAQRETVLTDGKLKKLTLHFLHDVSKEKLIEAWKEAFEKNCEVALMDCKQAPALIEKLTAVIPEVKVGDRIQITFLPSDVSIQIKDQPEILITGGSHFSKIMLSAWFGRTPPNEDLQSGLLGKH
jgi:hypothetical protein